MPQEGESPSAYPSFSLLADLDRRFQCRYIDDQSYHTPQGLSDSQAVHTPIR